MIAIKKCPTSFKDNNKILRENQLMEESLQDNKLMRIKCR